MFQRFWLLPLAQKIASITACLCLLSACILVVASHQGHRSLINQASALFGESLVEKLAFDASTALIQDDKLSLQSLLKELIESPMISRAVIYDIENQPVVEAGEPSDGLSFSASITFQDSIAGYAVVFFQSETLTTAATSLSWQLFGLSFLLSALVFMISLPPGRHLAAIIKDLTLIAATPIKKRRGITATAYRGQDELKQLAFAVQNPPKDSVTATTQYLPNGQYALLTIKLLDLQSELQQQSVNTVSKRMNVFIKQLKTICALYDGKMEVSRENSLSVIFSAEDDEGNYPFRAICSAFLIKQSLTNQPEYFDISIGISEGLNTLANADPSLAKQATISRSLEIATAAQHSIGISQRLSAHTSISGKITTSALESDTALDAILQCVRIDTINPPYDELLDKQSKKLGAQFSETIH